MKRFLIRGLVVSSFIEVGAAQAGDEVASSTELPEAPPVAASTETEATGSDTSTPESEAIQEPGEGARVAGVDEAGARAIQAIDERRRKLRRYLAGTLDPAVDVAPLLALDLTRETLLTAEDLREVLERVERRRQAVAAPLPPVPTDTRRSRSRRGLHTPSTADVDPVVEPAVSGLDRPSTSLEDARERLFDTYAEVLALAPEVQREKLAAHRKAMQVHAAELEALRASVATRMAQAEHLKSFLKGELDPKIDVAPLLTLDLSGLPGEMHRQDPEAGALWAEDQALRAELDALRLAFLRQPTDERRRLLDAHASAPVEAPAAPEAEPEDSIQRATIDAEEAEVLAKELGAAKAAALEQARRAGTEARRVIEQERARLLGIKEDLARFGADMARMRLDSERTHDAALGLNRRVEDLLFALRTRGSGDDEPDALYAQVRGELGVLRASLGKHLDAIRMMTAVPQVGEAPAGVRYDTDLRLATLRGELIGAIDRLAREEQDLRWSLAEARRDDIVMLNDARLRLLEVTSSALRENVTGLGPDGVRQVGRELEQIVLELRFHLLALPRHLRALGRDLTTAPIPFILGLLKFAAIVVLFRLWRRRARMTLTRWHLQWRGESKDWRTAHIIADGFWYLTRVHRPLEWLALFGAIYYLTPALEAFPEIQLAWIVGLWLLVGSAIILFVDALAAKETRYENQPHPTSAIRIRSLRLIGLAVVYTGLILSLADMFVGKGAIYAWVLKTCWLLLFPIAVLLVRWWRPHIAELLEREAPTPLVAWTRRQGSVPGNYVRAAVAGIHLLVRGVFRRAVHRAASFDTTRHFLAYLFRRGVARQAQVVSQRHLAPIPEDVKARLMAPTADLLLDVAESELTTLNRELDLRPGAILVLIGERGLGKTTLLHRLVTTRALASVFVECPYGGIGDLYRACAEALGLPTTAGPDELLAALHGRQPTLVVVDDLHRIVQPTIGGLRGFDEFGALMRGAGPQVAWVVTLGAAAWKYVERARSDRSFFHSVVTLRSWREDAIARLVRGRTHAAGVVPAFEGLAIPRQYDDGFRSEQERTEAGLYRILWDYSGGNPHVALHCWGESLFHGPGEEVVVQLFKEPPAAELDALPLTTKFVLRAAVQLESGTREELARAVRLAMGELDEILRLTFARGYLVETPTSGVSVNLHWFRAITRMLARQHLLGG